MNNLIPPPHWQRVKTLIRTSPTMSKAGVFWIFMLSGSLLVLNLFINGRYMKQSKKEVISQNNIESTANKREKNKNLRDNLKLFL